MSSFKVFLEQGRDAVHPLTSEELVFMASGQYTQWAQKVATSRGKKSVNTYFIWMLASRNWAMANVAIQAGLLGRIARADKHVLVYAWVELHESFLWLMGQDRQWRETLSKALPLEWILNLNALTMTGKDWAPGLAVVLAEREPKDWTKYPQADKYRP